MSFLRLCYDSMVYPTGRVFHVCKSDNGAPMDVNSVFSNDRFSTSFLCGGNKTVVVIDKVLKSWTDVEGLLDSNFEKHVYCDDCLKKASMLLMVDN